MNRPYPSAAPAAIGLLCVPLVEDVDTAMRKLRYLAATGNRHLVDTILYHPGDDWLSRLGKLVKSHGALAVVVLDEAHYEGEEEAITALSVTLSTPDKTMTYLSVRGGFRD